ncbi:MAG: 30S ribosome-binding factor RbfA [Fidelibacterota bacterium]|nr:MAG: 30S ribosome-binding factor RbfA [Candidatus Neomarinimicrobiota bacterium]
MAEEVQRILAGIFLSEIQIPSVDMLTVTRVELSKDLRIAKVYISLLNPATSKDDVLEEVLRRRNEIRYHLGKELRIKYIPELRFHLDESLEHAARINTVLSDLHREETESRK